MSDLQQIRDELLFIADGCLVPPDGGSPDIYDAMASAKRALIALDRMIETPAPQGWKIVPIEPTEEMSLTFRREWQDMDIRGKLRSEMFKAAYKAMLSAAPTPAPTEKVDIKNECALEWTYSNHAIQESIKMFPHTWETIRNALKYDKYAPTEPSFCGIKIIEDKSLDENEIRIYGQDKLKARLKLQSGETEKVDLDALKKTFEPLSIMDNLVKHFTFNYVTGWNECIDYLANTGRLR